MTDHLLPNQAECGCWTGPWWGVTAPPRCPDHANESMTWLPPVPANPLGAGVAPMLPAYGFTTELKPMFSLLRLAPDDIDTIVNRVADRLRPSAEFAWLVEVRLPTGVVYYTKPGVGWTTDPNRAIRFARKADADQIAEHYVAAGFDCTATEHGWAGVSAEFVRGAQMCREMLASFVEQGGDAITAASIRANWNPSWGQDPGRPA